MTVLVCIMAGLGTRHSNGIIINLKARLEQIPGVRVLAGSYSEYEDFAEELKTSPERHKIIIGHSLGGSVAPQVARLAGVPITAIFGFDPADNLAANSSIYGMTTVPSNVQVARAGYIEGGALGGGKYVADSSRTFVENFKIEPGHLDVDDEIERHLEIEDYTDRLAEEGDGHS